MLRHEIKRRLEPLAIATWRRLPRRIRERALLAELGALTCESHLAAREVPTITISELLEGLKAR